MMIMAARYCELKRGIKEFLKNANQIFWDGIFYCTIVANVDF